MDFLQTKDFATLLLPYLDKEGLVVLQEAMPTWHTLIAKQMLQGVKPRDNSYYWISKTYSDPMTYIFNTSPVLPFCNCTFSEAHVYKLKFLYKYCKDKLTLEIVNERLIMIACCLVDDEFIRDILLYPGFDISKIPYRLYRMYIRMLLGDPLCASINKKMLIGRNTIPTSTIDVEKGYRYYLINRQDIKTIHVYTLKYYLGEYLKNKGRILPDEFYVTK